MLVKEISVTPSPEICTTGLSAIGSLKVAETITMSPCFTELTVIPPTE